MTGLGEIIQAKRKELGLTQERLAEKIGKTAGYIGQIERGLSYPSYPVLLQLIETSLDKGTQRKTTENELPSLTQCTA